MAAAHSLNHVLGEESGKTLWTCYFDTMWVSLFILLNVKLQIWLKKLIADPVKFVVQQRPMSCRRVVTSGGMFSRVDRLVSFIPIASVFWSLHMCDKCQKWILLRYQRSSISWRENCSVIDGLLEIYSRHLWQCWSETSWTVTGPQLGPHRQCGGHAFHF